MEGVWRSQAPLARLVSRNQTLHGSDPIFDPSLAGKLVHQEPPFKEDLDRLPYPDFYYALEDLVASYLPSITHSVHRSSILIKVANNIWVGVLFFQLEHNVSVLEFFDASVVLFMYMYI